MANVQITHDNDQTVTIRQHHSNIVIHADQIDSVIATLELMALELRHRDFERRKRQQIADLMAWDKERRGFNAVYVPPVDSSQVVD